MEDAHDQPLPVSIRRGAVHIAVPAGFSGIMTPDVAEEFGLRLMEAAVEARGSNGSCWDTPLEDREPD